MMKQNVYFLLLLLVSMIIFSQASSRVLANKLQVEEEAKLPKRANDGDSIDKMGTINLNRLMGLEEYSCEDKNDQECIKRRVLEEAHLDYIYTQHHNHP
ncbi:putative phytosulfokines 6 [Solanum stenotomum]|uniref:putative phytosulfokines 6 n=1 Tax=Solanum stenotomum TaxID=172797 RepID=UPI0020D1EFC0|nr:putative phytosulfokines 6 [Solanum stenotomum]